MSATDTLNKVRTMLGLEAKLEQMKLENGTLLEADKFEAGQPVFIVTEDEKVALPVGSYEVENGLTLSVEDEGVIASLEEVKAEEVEEEVTEEVTEEETEETEDLGYVSKEEFQIALEEIKKMIDEVKAGYDKKEDKEEMAEEVVNEVEEEKAELKEELSKPAAKAIKHNPEKENQKRVDFKYATNRRKSTFDIILEKLNK